MELSYYKINPTGNITLIVETPVLRESQSRVASELMALDKDAEQVGFLEKPTDSAALVRLQMMGGEFCGNASISAAALTASSREIDKGSICLEVSGVDKPLDIAIEKKCVNVYRGTVNMPLPERIESICIDGKNFPIVHFEGISHIVADYTLEKCFAEKNIRSLCSELKVDALGIMFVDKGKLEPFVYVASTDSAVWESSCASGTTAVTAYAAYKGKESCTLSFEEPGGSLSVTAQFTDGAITSLLLTGGAEIMGRYLICT